MALKIYFSDFFEIPPAVVDNYGALNISLINDLPLFVDPFLLYESDKPEYRSLHDDIIRYVEFLRDVSLNPRISTSLSDPWFRFPEVRQNGLGFSRKGNGGTGLGSHFSRSLRSNLAGAFSDFGSEEVTRTSHLEKVRLLDDSVGRDHLSDFITNIVKKYFLEYTQEFDRTKLRPSQIRRFPVDKVWFNYGERRWVKGAYVLPDHDGHYVILTPRDILTKDTAWINRQDLLSRFRDIHNSIDDQHLRAQVDDHLLRHLPKNPRQKDWRAVAERVVALHPSVLDYYIKDKEEHGEGRAWRRCSQAKPQQSACS